MESKKLKNIRFDAGIGVILFLVFFAYLWVTFNSPIAFGDEGYYSSMGKWIAEHGEYPEYYPLWGTPVLFYPSTRPPMGHVISSIFYLFLGEAGIKFMVPFFAVFSAILIYFLFRSFGKRELGALTAFVFIMLPATVKYGVLNYPEIQMLFFITASVYFFFLGNERVDKRFFIASGAFLTFALLSDITAMFILPVYFFIGIYHRKLLKPAIAVLIVSLLFISPWILRNLTLFGSPCFGPIASKECSVKQLIDIEKYQSIKISRPEVSTGAGIYKFGLVQYIRFGFGVTGLLGVMGALFLFNRRKDWKYVFFLLWILALLFANLYISKDNPRTEDMLRYSIFGLPAIAVSIGLLLKEIKRRFKLEYIYIIIPGALFSILLFIGQYTIAYVIAGGTALVILISKYSEKNIYQSLALAIFSLLLFSVAFYGVLEIVNMHRVKQFSPGFIEACKWVQKNLPENATFTAIYTHPAEYNCYRRFIAIQGLPNGNEIRLWANETSYELLKKLKIDYILVEGFTIVPDSGFHGESEPMRFVSFLENSGYFEKIYDNTQKYGYTGGVRIFRVK